MRYLRAMLFPGLLRAMRPHQWVKNSFVLFPLIFAKQLFVLSAALRGVAAFTCFCLASSAVYLLNDLRDVEADRVHPVKKNRPIASGQVPEGVARTTALVLVLISAGGGLALAPWFTGAVLGYVLLNVAYSFRLKRVPYLDVLCIATGFELRVIGGAAAALVPPSTYLLLVTFLLASFLGFGKRMHELMQGEEAHSQRSVLRAYSQRTLEALLAVTALATVVTYVVYTLDATTIHEFGTKWLILTAPFTLFGVLRFLQLVRGHPHAESPTDEMLRDQPFIANLALWVLAVIVIIYIGASA